VSESGDVAFADTYVHEMDLLGYVQYARRKKKGLSGLYSMGTMVLGKRL
jgi:hypothetical protein